MVIKDFSITFETVRCARKLTVIACSSLVFRMVEAEEEYMEQMEVLVSCFLRPFRMAASSKKPPCSHEDVNSIFLNSETVLFLHQIFLKGLTSRMESWPTLVLGMYRAVTSHRHSVSTIFAWHVIVTTEN